MHHYLVVDPEKQLVVHHAWGQGEAIITRIVREGTLRLESPTLELATAEFFAT